MHLPTGPFALLRREGRDYVDVLTGPVHTATHLADLPTSDGGPAGPDILALVPYRQVRERGFTAVDDAAPLRYLRIVDHAEVPLAELVSALPGHPPRIGPGRFDVDDAAYERTVAAVLRDEIGRGEGSNFVIHRVYTAQVDGDPLATALAAYRRLLADERGAYWTFLIHTGDATFVGATPERHVSIDDGQVMMNPISGTYRHPAGGPDRDGLLAFLADRKEIDELYMVLDEELKMMATVADAGGQVVGPYLKEMAHLTHTEYLLVGHGRLDAREVLRQTMFAPTVVGSPIENACRVVARHERRGRGYYGGVAALIGRDEAGRQTLDAPILIRTAVIDGAGRLSVPVGATLVRHSTPAHEVAETHAKVAGVMAALGLGFVAPGARAIAGGLARSRTTAVAPGSAGVTAVGDPPPASLITDPTVRAELSRRNDTLARFWLTERAGGTGPLDGRRVLIVDAEDTFTGMLAHLLRALGLAVTLRSYRDDFDLRSFDLVVVGPGPGDPGSATDPKMAALRRLVGVMLATGQPMLAICLGHQMLSAALGLPLHRKDEPYQGTQREIDLFGHRERVGFYSTYTAVSGSSDLVGPHGPVEVSRDPRSGEVHALRGATFAGVQFHPESVLTEHGIDLLHSLVAPLVGDLVR
jgi:phenazine biosynthesis protein phzE